MTNKLDHLSSAAVDYLLTLADDEHMIGARHTSWIGLGPFIEEDLAFCSIAQDELGHAIALFTIVAGIDGNIDDLALRRAPDEYRSSWLAEWPTDDWAHALVRHWLYDRAEALRWVNVGDSSLATLADLVPGVQREEEFHLQHADQFLRRIGADTGAEVANPISSALTDLLPLAGSLWTPPLQESDALSQGIAVRTFAELEVEWRTAIADDLVRWRMTDHIPLLEASSDHGQNDRTVRSEHFADFHRDLNEVAALDPTAVW